MFNEFCFSYSIEPNEVKVQDINLSFTVTKETVLSMLQGKEGTRRVQSYTNHGSGTLWESNMVILNVFKTAFICFYILIFTLCFNYVQNTANYNVGPRSK